MIRRNKKDKVADAVNVLKWDVYAEPAPTAAEKKAAMELLKEHPDRWHELFWGPRP